MEIDDIIKKTFEINKHGNKSYGNGKNKSTDADSIRLHAQSIRRTLEALEISGNFTIGELRK